MPALKDGILAAAISIVAPVCGLRPVRAARSRTEKVPKPTNATCSPPFNSSVTASINESKARPAAALEMSAPAAILSFVLASCRNFYIKLLFEHQALS